MKKSFKYLGLIGVLLAGVSYGAQVCQRTDFLCFESGPSQNLSTPFRVDSSGNISTSGSVSATGSETTAGATNSGISVFTPVLTTGVQSNSTQTITGTYQQFVSSGGAVTITLLSTTTAVNGQWAILSSTSNVSTVTLTSGTANGMSLGAATRVLDASNHLNLIFDSSTGLWREIVYSSN